MFFSQDWRERIKSENPEAGFGEVGKLLGAKWKELDDEEKKVRSTIPLLGRAFWHYRQPYIEQAAKDKVRAEEDKAAYDVRIYSLVPSYTTPHPPSTLQGGKNSAASGEDKEEAGDDDDDE
jgi:hypothetical protein